jgi:hypothetical protein
MRFPEEDSMKRRNSIIVAILAALMIMSTAAIATARTSSGRTVIDAPNKASMKAKKGGDVRWILPGPRKLDPAVFGTPGAPLREELLPIAKRAITPDGYFAGMNTTTPMPTPFSNNWAPITGKAKVKVTDITSVSGSTTKDKINATFEFTSPDGAIEYKVVVKKALPEIPDHENFGGVGINALQHGATGIGTALMPQLMSFIAFWGAADLYVDGVLQPEKRFVHFMLSERVRDDDYNLVFNDGVNPDGPLQAHLILPPTALVSGAPVDSPVPTGFTLPNGQDQPFLHIMYETVIAKG